MNRILCGDVRERLMELPDESVHCVVTSPPYWSLRDYGLPPQVWGGDSDHRHAWVDEHCECGAWRGQLGLEPSVELYVDHVVDVFREVRRVLRTDGTLWLNMGDSYAGSVRGGVGESSGLNGGHHSANESRLAQATMGARSLAQSGLKRKDLVGQPWRVALALQRDGWWLRSDIIWHKPNAMPESAKDRPTMAHDHLFLLARSERYFYDYDAIVEPVTGTSHHRGVGANRKTPPPGSGVRSNTDWATRVAAVAGPDRNRRTVWSVPTGKNPCAHSATFPQALVDPCIRAGSPLGGMVLDPFMGTGTVALVALKLQRRYTGIELKPDTVEMAEARLRAEVPLLLAGTA